MIFIDLMGLSSYDEAMIKKQFIQDIDQFLRLTGMDATQFGIKAMEDGHFVHDVKNKGRNPRIDTIERVRNFMRNYTNE